MAHRTYNDLWRSAQRALEKQLSAEEAFEALDRQVTVKELSEVYARYIVIINDLGTAYDMIVQPQKRRLLRRILEASLGRLLEIKQELVRLEYKEVINLAEMLNLMHLQPHQIEIQIPPFYVRHRKAMLEERRTQFTEIYKKLGYIQEEIREKETLTPEEAILMIQTLERARQGRLRAQLMKRMRRSLSGGGPRSSRADTQTPDAVAAKIQAWWRGHVVRKKVQRQRREEMIFLGMLPPDPDPEKEPSENPSSTLDQQNQLQVQKNGTSARKFFSSLCTWGASEDPRWQKIKQERYRMQLSHESNYRIALVELMAELREVEGPVMAEAIANEIRDWFLEVKEKDGKLPDLPGEEDGGSALIFNPSLLPPKPKEVEKEGKKKGKSKDGEGAAGGKGGGSSASAKKAKTTSLSAQARRDKGKEQETAPMEQKMEESKFVEKLKEHCFEFQCVWSKRDESWNHDQQHEDVLIKAEKRIDLEREVRLQVDVNMREELEKLRATMEKDQQKKKKKKERKKRKKKDRKKKKMKDLTPDRTVDSLYEELVANGIIKMSPDTPLQSFMGHFDYRTSADAGGEASFLPMSLADIRRTISETCIIPLGSQEVHEKAPITRSVLIAGPRGTGKKMLVHAIVTELGATLFDLTARNIAGKYPGKSGLVMLMHLVNKVSRLLAPSIIWIDEADKTFLKKVSKGDKTEPRRLKKELPKFVKGIGNEDRILLLGTTSNPWNFDPKSLAQAYQRIILIPKPDFITRYTLWEHWIGEAVAGSPSAPSSILGLSELARLSEGYTPGSIKQVVNEVLSRKRVKQLDKKPLRPLEFIPALARAEPVYVEEEEAFQQWYMTKTPLGKKFNKRQEEREDAAAPTSGKKAAKTKKGKKGKKKKKKKK